MRQAEVDTTDLVVIADDDLGKNLVRVDRIRDLNTHCLVVCRVFHDDAAEILTQNPFRSVILSTSRLAAEQLVEEGIFREMGIVGGKSVLSVVGGAWAGRSVDPSVWAKG